MKMQLECVNCIVAAMTEMIGARVQEESRQRELMNGVLRKAAEIDWADNPPEVAQQFYMALDAATAAADPFAEAKLRSTEAALALLPEMRRRIAAAEDPFAAKVRVAIGGNIIDYGAQRNFDLADAVQKLPQIFSLPLDAAAVKKLRKKMAEARSILYVLDNCGEAVFDRLLLEEFPDKITLGVRGGLILNDVTRGEVAMSGLSDFPLVDTGTRTPGVSLKHSSAEFLKALRSADLVIAKGQGNFETLDGYDRPIALLFRVKCPVVAQTTGAPLGSLQVILKNVG